MVLWFEFKRFRALRAIIPLILKMRDNHRMNAVSLICLLLVLSFPAFAYVEPGTGSMLLQGLLAGAAGLVVVLKIYWYRIKAFFASSSPAQSQSLADAEADQKSSTDSEDSAA